VQSFVQKIGRIAEISTKAEGIIFWTRPVYSTSTVLRWLTPLCAEKHLHSTKHHL